jgi:hypothetical protein
VLHKIQVRVLTRLEPETEGDSFAERHSIMFGFLNVGDKVASTAGPLSIVGAPLVGGEGAGYKARLKDGRTVFYKQFTDLQQLPAGFTSHEAVAKHRFKRTEWLVKAQLHLLSPSFNSPFASATNAKKPGYVCAWLDGLTPWSEWREQAHPYGERLSVVGQLTSLLNLLHQRGIAHGDVNASNVAILGSGPNLTVQLIDFGNFNNGDPAMRPLMTNDVEHISPDLFQGRGVADMHSDAYALGVIAYEALLVKTIDSGGANEQDMRLRRANGSIPGDPLCGTREGDELGLPYDALSPALQTKLRGLTNPAPSQRPNIAQVKQVLDYEFAHNLLLCPVCNKPYFWRVTLLSCPCCKVAAVPPALHVQLPDRVVELRQNMSVGRDIIPGAPRFFSAQQLVIQPAHLGAARIFVTGRNSMKLTKTSGTKFLMTAQSGCVDVVPGDVLELEGTRISFLP